MIRSGSKFPSDLFRLLRRRRQKTQSPNRAIIATPPTTPPTIAPMFVVFTDDGMGITTGVLVDIPVVMRVVDPCDCCDLINQVNDCRNK